MNRLGEFDLTSRLGLAALGSLMGSIVGTLVAATRFAFFTAAIALNGEIVICSGAICAILCFTMPTLPFPALEAAVNFLAGVFSVTEIDMYWTGPSITSVCAAPLWAKVIFVLDVVAAPAAYLPWSGSWNVA